MDRINAVRSIETLEFLEHDEIKRKRKMINRSCPMDDLDDIEFHRRYRLTKSSVLHLLEMIKEDIQPNTHLNNSLEPLEQLLIALRFFATGTYQLVIGDLFKVSQPTISRVINKVSRSIASLRPQFIRMPETEEECLKVSEDFFRVAQFPGVIGAIDCSHIPVVSPGGSDAERFRCRKGFFSINTQTVSSADLLIQHVVARWPGSSHDSTILDNSNLVHMMETSILRRYHLVGDSGYPCKSFLLTPLSQTTTPSEIRYNNAHILTRNAVERSYGVLKRRFPCLQLKLRCSIDSVPAVIVACCVLHNLAVKLGDPEPPLDPEIQNYIEEFTNESVRLTQQVLNDNVATSALHSSASSAGFAKRRLLIQNFF